MRKFLSLLAALFAFCAIAMAKDYSVSSPSGDLKMIITVDETTSFTLVVKGQTVLENCRIAMELANGTVLGDKSEVRKDSRGARVENVEAPLYRQKSFTAAYNYLGLRFEGDYILQVRAYDDGVAYRFSSSFADDVIVRNEIAQFNFADNYQMYIPVVRHSSKENRFDTSFESLYTLAGTIGDPALKDKLAFFPILVKSPEFGNLLLMESDVEDYPGMFVQQTKYGLEAVFPPVPETFKKDKRGVQKPVTFHDYIAETSGSRNFPWRIIAYAADDTELPVNNMVYQTASPSRIDDVSWIEAGHSAWDWWNANTLYDVDFEAGINNDTYKFHIDFAAAHGMKYIILDEGWYKNLDPLQLADNVNVRELCEYASDKGVKLILWITGGLFAANTEQICETYSEIGVAGFKIDFFDSQDQYTVRQVYDLAETAQKYKLILDLHGIYKPTGLQRTYPNVLNFEGVFGLETCKWTSADAADQPLYDVTIPYIRMVSGPMDYTPGAMRNASRKNFRVVYDRPMSQGTRAHQIAEYVVFDAPLSMLCDSPSDYLADLATTDFITSIPACFESTLIPMGEVGKYIVTIREKDGAYYVGGLTNWESRDLELSLSFLPAGEWTIRLYRDGANAATVASDHKIETIDVENGRSLPVHMAPGGGFAMIITRK